MPKRKRSPRGAQPKRQAAADPRHPGGLPELPDFIDGQALQEWQRVVPILEQIGKVTPADRAILLGYVTAWAQWRECQAMVAGLDSIMVVSARGLMMLHPALQGRDKALAQMLECSKRLGLSPYDRERMKPPVAEDERAAEESVLEYAKQGAPPPRPA